MGSRHVSISTRKGYPRAPPVSGAGGLPGAATGGQRSCFSNLPTSLPTSPRPPGAAEDGGPSSRHAAQCHGACRGFGRACFTGTRLALAMTGASRGDLILPELGQSNRRRRDGSLQVPAEAQPLSQSLQPSTGSAGACGWGCKRMPLPAGDFCFRCPSGRKNIGSLSFRRRREEGKLLLCIRTLARAEAVALPQQRGTARSEAGLFPASLAGPAESHSHSQHLLPGQKHSGSLQEWHFPARPPHLLERSAYFCVGLGRGP